MQWYSDKRLLTDQDMTTTGDNIDYSVPKWKQAMSVNTNPSHLKHWILPNNQFKTHLFFSIFGWGGPFSAWISVRRVAQTSNLSGEAI